MVRIAAVLGWVVLGLIPLIGMAQEPPVSVVAAENVYGDVARQISGPDAVVTSILSSPDEDPHLFEASPSVARAIAGARIVVLNGAEYDPWMRKLLGATPRGDRRVIDVGGLLHVKPGANPHLWYDPPTMTIFARALAGALAATDPAYDAAYQERLARFAGSLEPMMAKIAQMRQAYAGAPVTATEPVFGLMAAAIGLTMRNQRFQLAVMNDTEPSAHDIAAFEHDLRGRAVRVLLYNSQATSTAARRLLRIAEQSHVPVVGVTETEPAGKTYQQWMLGQLGALDAALAKPGFVSTIALEGVTLVLGGRAVLSDVSLAIGAREFIGVLGPNGSGKTTLLRAILGLIRPYRGTLRVLGQPAARGNPAIGYLPQTRGGLTARLSGWDFVASAAGGHRWGLPLRARAEQRDAARVLELVGAGALAVRPLAELSGGERQRLLLAQALLGQPRLLLLDEPLISLDPRHQDDVVTLVRRVQQELGIAVLFSAHELNPLLGALDRVLYLGGGQAAIGAVDQVITGPVLSRLYGAEIEVLRVGGRIFVMSGAHEVEHDQHRHSHA